MAYNLDDVNGYGTGALGDVTDPSGQINTYANVTAIGAAGTKEITIGTPSNGNYETLVAGKEVLIHVSATASGSTNVTYLGKYMVAKIESVSGSVLTLDKDFTDVFPVASLSSYQVQVVTIAQFNKLTLTSGTITPIAYSVSNKYGGIIAIKCATELYMNGGAINLVDKGIPTASTAYRPLTTQETEIYSGNMYSTGWENHITHSSALMSCGDGVAMIWTKLTTVTVVYNSGYTTNSRIGGTAAGTSPYAYTNANSIPAATSAVGGSTILLVSETIADFKPALISKCKGSGKGYGRCHIVTKTPIDGNNAGLISVDSFSDKTRLRGVGISDFGDGSAGDVTNPGQINSYAAVTAINGKSITIGSSVSGSYGGFDVGARVLIHVSAKKNTSDYSMGGKFLVTKLIGVNGSNLTVADDFPVVSLDDYYVQLVSIPQFNNLTINSTHSVTPGWSGTSFTGGICVVCTKGTLNLSGGQLLINGKGLMSTASYVPMNRTPALMGDKMPIGLYHGAILLLCNNITLDANSRIGHPHTGNAYGGSGTYNIKGGGVYGGKGYFEGNGGFLYGNGLTLFVVADTITGFRVACFSVGGPGGYLSGFPGWEGAPGGSGYGGGGAYSDLGGGGGGGGLGKGGAGSVAGGESGSCFIYVNNLVSPDYTGVVI